MDKNKKWIDYIIELQSLAQAGLTYGKDVYDQERYERIRQLSAMMMADISNKPVKQVEGLFCNEVGYQTPKVKEEAGLDVVVKNVIAIQDREKHNQPIYAYKVCKIFMLCEVEGGVFKENSETIGFDYFTKDNLPILATEKNNEEQIQMCFDAYKAGEKWKTYFD